MMGRDDDGQNNSTAAMIEMRQKQVESMARDMEEKVRRHAIEAVLSLPPDIIQDPTNQTTMAMVQLANEGRYAELASMVEAIKAARLPPLSISVRGGGGGAGGGGAGGVGSVSSKPAPPRYSLAQKLCMRMGWDDLEDSKAKLHVVHDSGKVFVFGVKSGDSFTLQDEVDIFPSDQIVTQLRMVCSGE